jgi:hypothetical protein
MMTPWVQTTPSDGVEFANTPEKVLNVKDQS